MYALWKSMEPQLKSFDYDKISHFYDDIEVDSELNQVMLENLDRLFKRRGVSAVWDAACGTGAQALALANLGYKVTASDIGDSMLEQARKKSCLGQITFHKGDLCHFHSGSQDAVISMTNVLGHFNVEQVKEALDNVATSLSTGGVYIADFDNRSFLEFPGRIPQGFFVSGKGQVDGQDVQRLTQAKPVKDGIFDMHDRWVSKNETIHEANWDLKSWYYHEIQELIEDAGFNVVSWSDRKFSTVDLKHVERADSLLFIAEKK
jgi:ubiquinone/menaquinone biosynthesis C-methylase UbiE